MTIAFRPDRHDLSTIARLVARVLLVISLAMLIPAALGVLRGEERAALGLLLGAGLGATLAGLAELLPPGREVRWADGMVASGAAWVLAPVLCAVPLHVSGHFPTFLHAYFDAMSGLTCAGLSVMNDLDHAPDSLNLWRHLMQFLGGQGIVLLVLTFFKGGGGAVGMYAGEAREDKILPNVRRTARFIWNASLVYFAIGTVALTVALVGDGLRPGAAVFHAVNLFFAAFDTGGFSPRSASVGYYHSAAVEGVLIVLMIAGALSFALHLQLWRGRGRELLRNLEARVLAITMGLFGTMVFAGLVAEGIHEGFVDTWRRGLFQLVSAHSGAGFSSVPGTMFATAWGVLAPGALILAMTVGGMSGSTTGGIKAIRIGLVGKLTGRMAARAVSPPDAHLVSRYHHLRPQSVDLQAAAAATMVLLLFLALYMSGTVVGLFYGYGFEEALFESTSAAAGVGLSVGITSPQMESPLMVTYIAEMYLGRLEFISAFALLGYVNAMVRGRR